MSNKTKKSSAPRAKEQSRAKASNGRPAVSRSTVSRRQSGKPKSNIDLKTVRIIAAVLGLLTLAGAVAIVVQQAGVYPAGTIVLVVVLAFIAGLSAFVTVRPEQFANFLQRFAR
jgi:hypothetical protein